MKLGLLGTDPRMAAVAAATAGRGDSIVLAADLPAAAFPEAAAAAIDDLLDPAACDAVLVGADGWSDRRAEAVRMLVQAGRPILASHPLDLAMLWAWELDMIRRDAGGPLVPLLPERLHPFVVRLRGLLEVALAGSGPAGEVESLVLERHLADRRRQSALACFARDADLVRVLTGEPARLSAFGVDPANDTAGWQSLVVGLSCPTSLPVRWQAATGGEPGLTLSVHSAGGVTAVRIPDDWSRPWTWSQPGRPDEREAAVDPATILDRLAAEVEPKRGGAFAGGGGGRGGGGGGGGGGPPPPAPPPANWFDAARAIELADTVPRSLVKGRAIDLHQEEFTDLGTFRGTMASLGCGILVAALVLVIVAAIVGGLAHEFGWQFGGRLVGTWPVVALAALGLFLVLQVLPLLVAGGRKHE